MKTIGTRFRSTNCAPGIGRRKIRRCSASGLEIALTTYSLSDKKKFRPNLQLALDRGLSETNALAALTTVPAKLCGVENQLGTIEPGKLANLTVVDGASYFDPKAKVREVWIDGVIFPSNQKIRRKLTKPNASESAIV